MPKLSAATPEAMSRLGCGTTPRVNPLQLGACRALGRARAGMSCGAGPGVGEACGGTTQRADNDEWRRKSSRPFGLGLDMG